MSFNSSAFSIPILITLITEEEGSDEVLMEVDVAFAKITAAFNVIIRTGAVKRFG